MSYRYLRIARLAVCGLWVGFFGITGCFAAAAEQKIALVIGNSAYPSAALRNPVNDAKAMAARLTSLGFEVILRTDSNLRDMTRAVSQFGQKLKGGSVGLFYFAGHGMQVRGKNFLIPVDAEIENEASTRSEAVDVDQVLEQLGSARLSMVILDACRNNPFERRFRSTGTGGLAQIDAPTGTLLAYATAPGKVAYDGTGVNGLYTTELLKALDTPGLKVEDVIKQVRINVLKASDNQQIPWESSSLTGEFFFKPDVRPQLAEINAAQFAKERAELQKSLEDERRRRDQDAELLRKEMEKLRAELLKFSETGGSSRPIAGAPSSPVAAAPAQKPAPAPVATATQEPPTTLALAVPSVAPSATPPAQTGEWATRIALLDQLKGKLTFSKAIATLLNLTDGEDLTRLLTLEQKLNRAAWSNAHAIGVDASGQPGWASIERAPNLPWANSYSIEYCATDKSRRCRVVVSNGEFKENVFFEMASELRQHDFPAVRASYLNTLREPPREITLPGPGNSTMSMSQSIKVFVSASPATLKPALSQGGGASAALPALTAEAVNQWNRRIAVLAQSKGRLTYARAMALLLDITDAEDLANVARFERLLEQSAFSNAHALTLDARGRAYWTSGVNFTNPQVARDSAMEHCDRGAGIQCRIVYANREFRETEFFELANSLKIVPLEIVRESYLETLRSPTNETRVAGGATGTQGPLIAKMFTPQVARISASAHSGSTAAELPALSAAESEAWSRRIAMVEQAKGRLTYARAMAMLLDITDAEDLAIVVRFERLLEQSAFSNAHAMTLGANGRIYWASVTNLTNAMDARGAAIDHCSANAALPCKVVYSNREFRENEFFELLKNLRMAPLEIVRQSYIDTLKGPTNEAWIPGGTVRSGLYTAKLFTPQRP